MNIKIVKLKNIEEILWLYPEASDEGLEKIKIDVKKDLEEAHKGNRVVFGAQLDNKIVGAGQVVFKTKDGMADGKNIAHLHHGRVHPDYRNKGIGTTLINAREKEAKKRGFKFMTVSVELINEGAIRLDKRLGYEEFKRYKGKEGEELIALKKEL
ncbi:MAG: hypothetical protein A3F94_00475 [Candidatus Spechtbacteria bacterium RIFCSPLOWO2_12_FULL_38_22]|uniref:N-acetyltransferase domain-containing protein n=1 Tax=Candidatus Spechtbacteria bacterium RIFCSPLOWO2_12_FULL_38_22 TaxID=1802165 RepID=A0A1G2HFY9_9BACT|nr:MAG: hypothetical protein A2728_00720 [Candidatus Spechtbacteria bacterium RIFCSPHIGHO2_01_FULL_38_11]OGZ59503.1 MAG: hypothetical protein A3E58_02400 [Candidatus Spechtbacteria bacterium RIFCSPHIGHO2_12_FULL_38_30]OGZ59814.1 MAG: hypothetical protein A3A00_00165 [Candidatus Spechtbacteria bacterium RIFCSPLOWO2_01_FULL_38_20]OGZ61416.1 MAG: hypothetical protein A3F94_00475 [Candidatus Spechtbacteria bacterium RIFCSPLOWO2_12_FULL_38_22]